MPRPKTSLRNTYGLEPWKHGYFKKYYPDMLFDFKVIYQTQLKRFESCLHDDFKETVKDNIRLFQTASAGLQRTIQFRVYLVSDFYHIQLVLYNLDECLFSNLERRCSMDCLYENDQVSPNYVVSIFAFEGKKLAFTYDLSISTAIELTIAFKAENLIYAGILRDKWYSYPRRKAREDGYLE